jgi:hypothetical protein
MISIETVNARTAEMHRQAARVRLAKQVTRRTRGISFDFSLLRGGRG